MWFLTDISLMNRLFSLFACTTELYFSVTSFMLMSEINRLIILNLHALRTSHNNCLPYSPLTLSQQPQQLKS